MTDLRKRGLGRGLGALIPGGQPIPERPRPTPEAERTAAISAIVPNPFQPRAIFDEAAIDELAASIREKGLLQPLLVRPAANGYQLIAGERRFRAAQRAGLDRVPISVREVDDVESLELALIENLQRENLNPVEEARAFKRLGDEFDLSQEDIADARRQKPFCCDKQHTSAPASALRPRATGIGRALGRPRTQSPGARLRRGAGVTRARERRRDGCRCATPRS